MPKDLFHSLPQKKQDAILSAALREFSVHEYHAASINQIIKFADISRGSFYLYFDDKEDLYLFLLERSLQLRLDAFAAQQKSASYCNIFVFHEQLFLFNLTLLADPVYAALYRNLYLSMEYRFSLRIKALISRMRSEMVRALEPPPDALSAIFAEDALRLLQLITQDLLSSLVLEERTNEEVYNDYKRMVQLIRHTAPKE